jgi:hypothetical protein
MKIVMHVNISTCVALAIVALTANATGQVPSACPLIPAEQIVQSLVAKNAERAEKLPAFKSTRSYRVDYGGFGGSRDAEMIVEMEFTPPRTKNFRIVQKTGSNLLNDRVIKKLMDEEKLALEPENLKKTALDESNYGFTLQGCEITPKGSAYVFEVVPRGKSKYLYRGKIWIDVQDFAVKRIVAEPAKNPSFWVKQAKIEQQYKKVDQFWLPAKNHSVSSVRLGGHADLTIVYGDYAWTAVDPSLQTSNRATSK